MNDINVDDVLLRLDGMVKIEIFSVVLFTHVGCRGRYRLICMTVFSS